jgi:hypothetical protein
MTFFNGSIIGPLSIKTSTEATLSLSAGLACFTLPFSGVTTFTVPHGLGTQELLVEFLDSNNNLLIPDNWSIVNLNAIEVEFDTPQQGNVTVVGCIASGLAPITGGVILVEGLSGIIDLDCPDGSNTITTSGQVINICGVFTPTSGALLEQKCDDINTLSGIINNLSPDTQMSINGLSGAVTLKSVNEALHITQSGQSICLESVASGIEQLISLSGLTDSIFAVTNPLQTTTSLTFIQALTLPFTTNTSGIFRVSWSMEGSSSSNNKVCEFRVQLDDTEDLMLILSSFNVTNGNLPFGGFKQVTLPSGNHQVDIDFRFADTGGFTAELERMQLEVWKLVTEEQLS